VTESRKIGRDDPVSLERLGEDSEYVFGMYKRFHSHVEGKGLGLFMCRNQAEALGGRIEVRSVVGQGTTFRLLLPPEAGLSDQPAEA
jgi:hypothetical protein